jgi:hypothetical protein
VIKPRIRLAEHVACIGERGGVYRVLVENPEVKRPLGIPKRSWEYNIKRDLQEVEWRDIDWIDLA